MAALAAERVAGDRGAGVALHGGDGPRACVLGDGGLVLREGRVLRPQRSRAPQGELLARTGGGQPWPEEPCGSVARSSRCCRVRRRRRMSGWAASSRKNASTARDWDITFSVPKSVSLGALVMGDARVIRAHAKAVRGDAGLDRAGSPADPGLGSGDEAPAAGEGEGLGCGGLSPPHQPGSRSPASHSLHSGEHDALERRRLGRASSRRPCGGTRS